MNNRELTMAILNYENFDRLPVVHFGFWGETINRWVEEGKLKPEEADGNIAAKKLGFDYEWGACFGVNAGRIRGLGYKVLETTEDGFIIAQNDNGLIEKYKPGISSIPATIGTLLTDRKAWEELYLPRFQWEDSRVDTKWIEDNAERLNAVTDNPVGFHLGSYYGSIRDMLGVPNLAYLQADDEDLYYEIIDTTGNLISECAKRVAETCKKVGLKLDFVHFWEDICFKNGPLVNPAVFDAHVGPHIKKTMDYIHSAGVKIASLDCDGCIDKLVPTWIHNGINTMFPIEVGTWEASVKPWREEFGRELRGVGGMDKRVFAYDYAAVDAEIERLKPLIALGGYIPCPDHRIAPDAKYENVQYYAEKIRELRF